MVVSKKKVIIGIIVAAIIILIINLSNSLAPEPTIENYLKSKNFTNEEGSVLYYKEISEIGKDEFNIKKNNKINATYEVLVFNTNKKQLTKNKLSYENEIFETFIPTYDYIKQELTYINRIVYNNTSIIIEGTYNMKTSKFTCENKYIYNFNIEEGKDAICNKIKYDVEDFKKESINLITDKELLKSLKKDKNV